MYICVYVYEKLLPIIQIKPSLHFKLHCSTKLVAITLKIAQWIQGLRQPDRNNQISMRTRGDQRHYYIISYLLPGPELDFYYSKRESCTMEHSPLLHDPKTQLQFITTHFILVPGFCSKRIYFEGSAGKNL